MLSNRKYRFITILAEEERLILPGKYFFSRFPMPFTLRETYGERDTFCPKSCY